MNEEFTRRTGIHVNYTTFATNEELYAKLAIGGSDYDVIIPSDYMVAKLIRNDMLEKLDFDNIPNFSFIDENFRNPQYDPTNEYSVPYTWGTVGIFYNKNMVEESEDEIGWDILWDPKYAGQILMLSLIHILYLWCGRRTAGQSSSRERLSRRSVFFQRFRFYFFRFFCKEYPEGGRTQKGGTESGNHQR